MSPSEGRVLRAAACATLALALGGCVETALREAREPFDYAPLASPRALRSKDRNEPEAK